jgi:hypothetical protein
VQKRRNKKIWGILLGICIILSGCTQNRGDVPSLPDLKPKQKLEEPTSTENKQEEAKTVKAALYEITRMELIYLGEQNGYHILLSPYEDNLLYQVEDEANILLQVPPFSQFSLATDLSEGSVFLASCQTSKGKVPIVQAETFEEVAAIYPQALLAYFKNSLFWQQYSLEEYTIQSVRFEKDSPNHSIVTFVCNVEPSYSPFDKSLGYFWSQGNMDKLIENKEVSIDLYGFNGIFSCSPVYPIFLEKADEFPAEEAPLYIPVLYEDGWQAMIEGKETEDVIYEENPYAYVIGTRLVQEELDLSSGTFSSTIYIIDTQSNNQRKILIEGLPKGLFDVTPFSKTGDWLFCTSSFAAPYSESEAGQVIALNLKSGEYKTLLPRQSAIMGSKGDWFYFAVMQVEDGRQDGIYKLDVNSETVERLAPLPGEKFNTAYYGSFINFIDGTNIYFSWPNEADFLQEYTFFVLDSKQGRITQLK